MSINYWLVASNKRNIRSVLYEDRTKVCSILVQTEPDARCTCMSKNGPHSINVKPFKGTNRRPNLAINVLGSEILLTYEKQKLDQRIVVVIEREIFAIQHLQEFNGFRLYPAMEIFLKIMNQHI